MEQINTASIKKAPKASKEDYVNESMRMLSRIDNFDRLKRIYTIINRLHMYDREEQANTEHGGDDIDELEFYLWKINLHIRKAIKANDREYIKALYSFIANYPAQGSNQNGN